LLAALGLAESASEAEAVAAVQAMLNATGEKLPSAAAGKIEAWKLSAQKAVELSQKVAELEGAAQEREVSDLIEGAKRDGKVTPALEAPLREMGKKDMTQLKTMLSAMPKLVTTAGTETREPGQQAGQVSAGYTLSEADRRIAEMLGNDPKALSEHMNSKMA